MAPIFARDTLLIRPFPIPDEITTPGLTTNLICRIGLALLSNILCLVPLHLLIRNRELAPGIFIVNNIVINFLTVINAVIWPNDDMDRWWTGYGWCDLHPYLFIPMMTLYTTTVLTQAREMASKVSMLRTGPLSAGERRKKFLVQGITIFLLPFIQLIWIHFITAQRYMVLALSGCDWRVHGSWPYLVFFALPAPILALVAGGYAVLTFVRYRQVAKSTRQAFMSNGSATMRQNRVKRRLYFFLITLLIPYVPIQVASAAWNLYESFPLEAFNFQKIRQGDEFPWDSIVFVPSGEMSPIFLYNKYIPIYSGIIIFLYFGLTQDAYEYYRKIAQRLRLDKWLPRLEKDRRGGRRQNGNGRQDSVSWGTQTDTTDTTLRKFPHDSPYQLSSFGDSTLTSSSHRRSSVPVVSPVADPSTRASTPIPSRHGDKKTSRPADHPSIMLPGFKNLTFQSEDITDATINPTNPTLGKDRATASKSNVREPSTPLREYFSTPASPGDQPILTGAGGLSNPFIFRTQLTVQSAAKLFSPRLPTFLKRGRNGNGEDSGGIRGSNDGGQRSDLPWFQQSLTIY